MLAMATDAGKPTTIWLTNEELDVLKAAYRERKVSRSGLIRELIAKEYGLVAPTVHPAGVDDADS